MKILYEGWFSVGLFWSVYVYVFLLFLYVVILCILVFSNALVGPQEEWLQHCCSSWGS